MKYPKKWLTISSVLTLSLVMLMMLSIPAIAAPEAPTADSLSKEVMPAGAVDYGDTLTYTVRITPTASTIQMPIYFRDDLPIGVEWQGFVGDHAGFGWDATSRAITSTQIMTDDAPIALTFIVQVMPRGSGGVLVDISNTAALCTDPTHTVSLCVERSNTVVNTTQTPYFLYLPVVMLNYSVQ
ncbi:MAG: hypothetical protein JXA33_12065 [Anaerolineae bacterium]|nr:hypothetical protein [Anaerolineae bacterium]